MLYATMSFEAGPHSHAPSTRHTYHPVCTSPELVNATAAYGVEPSQPYRPAQPMALPLALVSPPSGSIASSDSASSFAPSLQATPQFPYAVVAQAALSAATPTATPAQRFGGGQGETSSVSGTTTPPHVQRSGSPNLVYWLRGLPFQAQRSDVEAFLKDVDFNKLDIGVLENGECSGNAFVELKGSKNQAELEELHNAFIVIHAHAALESEVRPKPRFVEVMPSNPAKRLEQLEHDRTLTRGATKRQRRLQSAADNLEGETSFNHQQQPQQVYYFTQPPPMPATHQQPPPPQQPLAAASFTAVPIQQGFPLPQQTQQHQSYYFLSNVPLPAVTTAPFFTTAASYSAPPPPAPSSAAPPPPQTMVALPSHFMVNSNAANKVDNGSSVGGGTPPAYPMPYEYILQTPPTAFFGSSISVQQAPQPQPVMFSTPYNTTPMIFPRM